MPNIKSAKKRVLVTKAKAQRNKSQNTALKTAIKKAHAAVTANAADKDAVVTAAIKKVDQAAAKGLIHKNNASRKKSALAKLIKEA
jgi:small subunit ribosomal protein S20